MRNRPTMASVVPAIMQSFEVRQHLSVAVRGHTLVIVTTDGKDVVTATMGKKTHFTVTVNGKVGAYTTTNITRLDITTKDAADLIDLRGLHVPADVDGGRGSDTIYGSRRADSLFGSGGADFVYGMEDNDTVVGGLRNDSLDGGVGNDTLVPYSDTGGDDTVVGGDGIDTVDYSAETRNITIQVRDDGMEPSLIISDLVKPDIEIINTGSGNDSISSLLSTGLRINGGAGSDVISGGSGDDTISGGPGADLLQGNDGNDLFRLGGKDGLVDTVEGGSGTDSIFDSSNDPMDVITSVP